MAEQQRPPKSVLQTSNQQIRILRKKIHKIHYLSTGDLLWPTRRGLAPGLKDDFSITRAIGEPDSVIQKFEDEEFDEYSLLTLSRDKISELIVKQGPRSKFEFELEKLKRKNLQDCSQSPSKKTKQTTDEFTNINSIETTLNPTGADLSDIPIAGIDSTQDTILEVPSQIIPDEQFVRYNLIEVLSKSPDGQCGLAYYNHHKKLDDAHRNKIARCVVSDIILRDSNKKLTRSVAECVTNEIVKQFESEKLFKNIWYDKSGGINSGKLFVQYHGIRRKLRSSGVIPSQKKNNQS